MLINTKDIASRKRNKDILFPDKIIEDIVIKNKIVRIDSDLLDILLTWDQLSGIEVAEISADDNNTKTDDEGDWMTSILQSKAFLQVPPANIQTMFMRMQEMPVKAGTEIIKQDDDGDYYYIIKQGKCKVTRSSKTGKPLTLATIGVGDAFGEEALSLGSKVGAKRSK